MAARCTTRWKPAVGFGSPARSVARPGQILVEELAEILAQLVEIDAAGAQHGRRVAVVGQAEQQMFQRGIFVPALAGEGEGAVQRLLKVARQHSNDAPSR